MSEKITKTYQDLIEENVIVLIKDNPEGLKILNSIFKNLINFPKEKKYKTLKTSNQKLSKVMTKEFISILKLSEFQEIESGFEYPSEEITKLEETLQMINIFEFTNKDYTLEEFLKLWNGHLEEAEAVLKERNFKKAHYKTDLALSMAQRGYKRDPFKYAFVCIHSYYMLGVIFDAQQEHTNAVEAYKTASNYISNDLLNKLLEEKDKVLMIVYEVNFRCASHILHFPSHDTKEVLYYLDRAWRVVNTLGDDARKLNVTNTYIAIGIYTKDNKLKEKWQKVLADLEKTTGNSNPFITRFTKIEEDFNDYNAHQRIEELIQLADDGIKAGMAEFSASIYGQIIYHHRLSKSLNLEDGIHYGQKALDILLPMFGDKHFVVRNVYLSLTDTYKRLGDSEKADEYEEKQRNSEILLGIK